MKHLTEKQRYTISVMIEQGYKQKEIDYVQYKLNNRPRKRLGFLSPIEFVKSKYKQKVAFAA